MSSRINRDFYGANDNTHIAGTWKSTYYWIQSLPRYGGWDLSQNGDFDTSAAPWGMPECSWSALPWIFAFNDSGILTLEKFETKKRNTPLYFMYADASTGKNVQKNTDYAIPDINAARALMGKSRIIGKTTGYTSGDNYYIDSTNAIDNGYHLNTIGNQYTNEPLKNTITTFLDYQKIKMIFRDATFLDTSYSGRWSTHTVNAEDLDTYSGSIPDENVGMISAVILPRFQNDVSTSFSTSSNFAPFIGAKTPIPERLKKYYYDDNADEWIQMGRSCSVSLGSINGRYFAAPSTMITLSAANTKSSNFPWSQISMFWGNWSEKKQVFDDVSYHWELMSGTVVGNKWIPINDGGILGSTNYQRFLVMKIDAHNYDTIYQAFKAAVMHEIAFLGFPFIIGDSLYTQPIGTNGVYLPIFDTEHMMTTGRFINSSDSTALDQINYTWGDVFDSTVPEYDPTYVPPEPEPEEGDYGDLNNLGHNRYVGTGLSVYVIPTANYIHNFLPALNALYQNKTPDDWTLDFQGENPSNYIVSVFNTFFAVPTTTGTPTTIKLGVVDTGIAAQGYDRGKPQAETFTFGTRHIDPIYNDFRDYAPYTNIELYLPLCGTIPLETAYVMNHDITINYWYDITTMACTACVYRDNMLYKTLDGSLGVPQPLLASDMGNYQNQIKQLENAKTQNNMRIATSAVSLTAGIAATVASGGTAIVPEAMGIAGGVAGLSKSIETANEIEYKIDHITPSISTTGASESQNNMCVGQLTPKLIIKRPLMLPNKNDAVYSKTVGNACCINNTVGDNSGLIKCSNVDLSGVTATASEISAIQNLLTSGIYV